MKRKRFKCKFCGLTLPALPATQAPNGALRLGHLRGRTARVTAG